MKLQFSSFLLQPNEMSKVENFNSVPGHRECYPTSFRVLPRVAASRPWKHLELARGTR